MEFTTAVETKTANWYNRDRQIWWGLIRRKYEDGYSRANDKLEGGRIWSASYGQVYILWNYFEEITVIGIESWFFHSLLRKLTF